MQNTREIKFPNAIQPREYSTGSGTDGILHIALGSSWMNRNDNQLVPYLVYYGDDRRLNLNYYDNDWNDNCRFLALRKSFILSWPSGEFIV